MGTGLQKEFTGFYEARNRLICGDNLRELQDQIENETIDLIYLDPPFCSLQNYHLLSSAAENEHTCQSVSFNDVWHWNEIAEYELAVVEALPCHELIHFIKTIIDIWGKSNLAYYLCMMSLRLFELHRVLKSSGSIYLHCDQYASAYLRILMDIIFGRENFLNNIAWCYGLGGSSNRRWPRKHDDILWYSKKNDEHYFKASLIPATSYRMKGEMKKAPDYWNIPTINNMAKERTGYPTQKPEALLHRIITSSSREGNIVLDPFCGSGTTLIEAHKAMRRWVGIDQNAQAIEIAIQRLDGIGIDRTEYEMEYRNELDD